MKSALKSGITGLSLVFAFLPALLSAFGRIRILFTIGAQMVAQVPGIPGDYLRVAYYRMTLRACSLNSRISFGTFFSNPDAEVAPGVYIGAYSILGRVRIGEGTQIASHVQVLSGAHQHARDSQGRIQGSQQEAFEVVRIGAGTWIGAGAIVMASVGDHSIIGAGSIVTKEIPSDVMAMGNPARIRPGEITPET